MEPNYWHQRWENNHIAFHENDVNPLLVKNFGKLFLPKGHRIFIPLCGKTLDIFWFLSEGYTIVGIELSKVAIDQLFIDLELEPKRKMTGKLIQYSAQNIDIFVGDLFNLTKQVLGPIDATYDRAALVALPETMRKQYTRHVIDITNNAPQILISYEYDQNLMKGPPFSVPHQEIDELYGNNYNLSLIENIDLPGLKGKVVAKESVWLLKNYT